MPTVQKNSNALAVLEGGQVRVVPRVKDDVRNAVVSFLDMAATATGKSTFYNTKDEQNAAIDQIHDAVFAVNRGLYAAMLTLPGLTDYSCQRGLIRLLNDQSGQGEGCMITEAQESTVVAHLADKLPPTRLLKLYGMFRENKVNNKRTRTLILRSILGSQNLEWWSVKYRTKMRTALTHAWGRSTATYVRETLSKKRLTSEDQVGLSKLIDKYVSDVKSGRGASIRRKQTIEKIYECVSFVLGGDVKAPYENELIKSYFEAQSDLSKGKKLPLEVLEGIRSVYHKEVPHATVIEMAKATMTEGDKIAVQRSAQKAGVEVDFDPTKQDMVKLYVYAMEMGVTREIREALNKKAREIAATLPVRYGNVGIVVDTSRSMYGTDEQKRRPLAIALAMRDILAASATGDAVTVATGGDFDQYGFAQPKGETALADALIESLEHEPDVVFMITDGYENAPAGRTAEVVERLRKMGIETPIYQLTPVMAAEAAGRDGAIRRLSKDIAPMPITRPEGFGVSMVRAALANDIENGIKGLLNRTIGLLEAQKA